MKHTWKRYRKMGPQALSTIALLFKFISSLDRNKGFHLSN
jgi:hypothetical protein